MECMLDQVAGTYHFDVDLTLTDKGTADSSKWKLSEEDSLIDIAGPWQ